jgi:3-oxoacyl-[acyl-carrier-protein] synthase II
LRGPHVPVWERGPTGAFALGSAGIFVVLEARAHAERRGASPYARVAKVLAARGPRRAGSVRAELRRMWEALRPDVEPGNAAAISGATGVEPATKEELSFLLEEAGVPFRATGTYMGHAMEPQFLLNAAIAALTAKHGRLFAPARGEPAEGSSGGAVRQVVVTGVGHCRGEGMALVEAVTLKGAG